MFRNSKNLTSDSSSTASSSCTASSDKTSFLKNTEEARLKRQLEKKKQQSALLIQSCYRGYRERSSFCRLLTTQLDTAFSSKIV